MPGEVRFTAIPHVMLEKLFKARLSSPAREVLDVIFRWTLGWDRDCHSMAISFFEKATGRHRNVIARALMELEHRRIIRRYNPATFRHPARWGLCEVGEWREAPHKVRVTRQGDTQSAASRQGKAKSRVTWGGGRRVT